jgi:sugar/nucleoside kinase (ribokinase family)
VSSLVDVTGLGNAIVDVLGQVNDAFLVENKLTKGTMALIDEARAAELYGRMGQCVEISGGSCANTMVGIASLGGRAAYIGKVRNDALGDAFTADIRRAGVRFNVAPLTSGPTTARCLIAVSPDAQRTMSTFLGASRELGPDAIDEDLIRGSQIVYMEGYLWDPPAAKEAFLKASRVAELAGRKSALTLSDPFCVERHRAELLKLVDENVDILFANEAEICALYQVGTFEEAERAVRGRCEIAVLTRSERGSVIVTKDESIRVPVSPVSKVVDTTGAGDLYAAGFLYGVTQGTSLARAGELGAICAAEVISHVGARPEASLSALVAGSAQRAAAV